MNDANLHGIPRAADELYALTHGAGLGYLSATDAPKRCGLNAAALAKTFATILNKYDGATGTLIEAAPAKYDSRVGYRFDVTYPVGVTLRVVFGVVGGTARLGIRPIIRADQEDIVNELDTHFREVYADWIRRLGSHPMFRS